METLFDNDCRYMSDSELMYELSNSRQLVSNFEKDIDTMNLDDLFSSLTPGRKKVAIAAVEMYKRQQSTQAERRTISMSKDIFDLMQPLIGQIQNEEFWVIAINNASKVIKKVRLSVGGLDFAPVDIRLLIRVLIESGATRFAVVHNHPSGNNRPSMQDKNLTEEIRKAGNVLNLNLIDHVIIANKAFYSFSDEGLL